MERSARREPKRDPRFLDMYRAESVRMHHATPQEPRPKPAPEPASVPRDAAVILPLLLLLMTEGADRYLLLALLYILL